VKVGYQLFSPAFLLLGEGKGPVRTVGVFLGRVAGLEIVAKRLSELDLMSLSLQPATLLSELCRFLLLTS
jgi:hypothetical protein